MHEALIGRAGLHLRSWVTGRRLLGDTPGGGTATVVLEDAAHLPALLASDVVGPRSLVLVPRGDADFAEPGGTRDTGETPGEGDGSTHGSGAVVVGFEGSLSEPGGDASIGGALFLQVQDYGTSPYMSLLGTTLVRVAGEADFEAFLADADRARLEGEFAAFAVSPAVQLADLPALGSGESGDGPGTRLWVAADGGVSVSPQGARLGTVGDSAAALDARWAELTAEDATGAPLSLTTAVPEGVRAAQTAERPWLARYMAALDVLRDLHVHGVTDVRVSGFGGRLVPSLESVDGPRDADDPRAPFLAWTPEAAYVRVPGHDRTFRLGRPAAGVAERLLVHGSPASALEHARAEAGGDAPAPLTEAAVTAVLAFFTERGVPLLPGAASDAAPAEVTGA
ncbi:daptide biosynthesis RiPP recognition protein [Streptomyces sp. NPDC060198]|uniref:daptide biosynthesis RiPP recognition protein n=1 Tax=Streptomyces sp. NPDC060198 TaxID=3347070 RepID=UPI0036694A8C